MLEAIQDALRTINRLPWTFLVKRTRVVTHPERTTPGGVTVTRHTRLVRFTSLVNPTGNPTIDGTWGVKFAGEDVDYDFASVAATTSTINLTSSYVGTASLTGAAYRVSKRSYDLPNDFRELLSITDVRAPTFKMRRATYQTMLTLNLQRNSGDKPHTYSIEAKSNDTGNMKVKQLWLYPSPNGTNRFQYDLIYASLVTIPDSSTSNTAIIDWPDEYMDVLRAAIDVQLAKKAQNQEQLDIAREHYKELIENALGGDVDDSYSLYIGEDRRVQQARTPFDINVTEGG